MAWAAMTSLVFVMAGGAAWAQAPQAAPVAPQRAVVGMTPGTGPNAPVAPVAPVLPAAPAKPVVAAKALFGAAKTAAPLEARAIGYYSRGCLAGAQRLEIDGPEWQVMRLSRNRNWGHPALISFLERFASDARREGWSGLLVGDLSQPRGGPMLTGHASHQVGLDADIWFTPMPDRRLTRQEREDLSATDMLVADRLSVNANAFSTTHVHLVRRAALFGEVERIFVHPAIKKALCQATANTPDRAWLTKVRPTWGHDHHFHVRIGCPQGMQGCQTQPAPAADDGCGKELDDWFKLLVAPPKPDGPPAPPAPPMTMDALPAECRAVLAAPIGGKAEAPATPQR